jgi:pimeloyl-ACP methyl ester carboxylesterase
MLLKNLPVFVLTHDPMRWNTPANFAQAQPLWEEVQMELADLSANSSLVVAIGSDHDIHVERPELVIQAVRRVYNSVLHSSSVAESGTKDQLQ